MTLTHGIEVTSHFLSTGLPYREALQYDGGDPEIEAEERMLNGPKFFPKIDYMMPNNCNELCPNGWNSVGFILEDNVKHCEVNLTKADDLTGIATKTINDETCKRVRNEFYSRSHTLNT